MNLKIWLKAARLPAQTFIIPALVLGQAFLYNQTQNFSLFWLILIQLYGLLMHFFIVFSNDYADYETDQLNQTFTPFTGGSRVLVDGNLSKQQLLKATWVTLTLTVLVALTLSFIHANGWIVALAGIGILIMHAYSFNPIKLSYRGFGETLQMVGVGVVLPLVGYLGQGGDFSSFPWGLMVIFLPSQLAMAIGTALPDEPSDRRSSKKTSAVLFGLPRAQALMIGLFGLSSLLLLSLTNVSVPVWKWMGIAVLLSLQLSLLVLKRPRPGELSMLLLVSLSILTNTFLVAGFASLLF